ncbi:NAD(P)-dependent oxidoreductase [Luteitalea sp. TBR-22]|uniref:NAD(P)H-binding protein n=1 Tax=Luteitalea sp. TBR-22 TaxID=2802971 RepID=UPI001AF1FAC9|nr:NAD(P)H-binding protein [Luteitalea sp. TBR-22]BCS31870.1 NAD(P)-dependent oxidoreductase [Luteitalea sp. TBR-22]
MATHTNSSSPIALIVGAHGTVGSALSPLLTARGYRVRRATSRAPHAADEVHLNLLTGEGLSDALAGVDQAFLMAPPGHVNQDVLLGPAIDAARAHGLRRVVLMSAMGANADERSPLRLAEKHLQASGLAWNVIRPNWFMQNFNSYWIQGIREQGQIFLPVGQARGSFIDARDIAAVAAALLTTDTHTNAEFDLTGAEALDHDQVAAILSQATGRTIGYTEVTPEAMRPGLLAAGLSPEYADLLLLLLSYFKAGYAERTTDAVQRITGRAPISFDKYAHDYREAWA